MVKVVLIAESAELQDEGLREWFSKLDRKVDMINDRTKKHTREIKALEKKKRGHNIEVLE